MNVIYAFVEIESGDVLYVGKTEDLNRRIKQHLREAKKPNTRLPIHRWLASHGESAARVETIELIETNWQECERSWIKHYRDLGQAKYNITDGGDGWNNYHQSEEHKRKISESLTGHKQTPETIEKCRIASTGKLVTQETREKLSRAGKGLKRSPETRERMSKAALQRRKTT